MISKLQAVCGHTRLPYCGRHVGWICTESKRSGNKLLFQEWLRTIASTLKWSFPMFRRFTECAMTCRQCIAMSTKQSTNQPQPTHAYLCRPLLTFLQMIYKVYYIVYKIKTFSRNFHVWRARHSFVKTKYLLNIGPKIEKWHCAES